MILIIKIQIIQQYQKIETECIKPYEYVSQHPTIPAFLVGGCSSVVLRVGCIVSNIGHHVATEIWQIPGVKQQD